jgi:hypothetical protein
MGLAAISILLVKRRPTTSTAAPGTDPVDATVAVSH